MMNVPDASGPVPVPFAGLGIGTIDHQGRYAFRATMSFGGQVQNVDSSGSIQVNADCTATATYTSGPMQGADRLVILGGGSEMRSMPTTFPSGPFAGMFYFRRVAFGAARCTSEMVRGVYAGPREGTQMMPVPGQSQPVPVPFSAIHTATFRNGTGKGASTASLGGAIVDFDFPALSLEVNPDCTASMKYKGASNQFPGATFTGAVRYVVLNYGDELIGLDTEANTGLPAVVLDNLKRISLVPIVPER